RLDAVVNRVAHPRARVRIGKRGIVGVVAAPVELPGLLVDEPRSEFGTVPWTVPVGVVLGHLHVDVFFADAGFGEGEKLSTSGHVRPFARSCRKSRAYVQPTRASRCCSRLPIGDT